MSTRPPNRLISDDDDETPVASAPAAGGQSEVARAAAPTESEGQRKRKRSSGQGPYPGRRQVTAHIDRQLFLWLKSISAQTDKPMVEIFEEALSAYVNSFAAQRKFGAGPSS